MVKNIHFVTNGWDTKSETNLIKWKYMNKENLWNDITLDINKPADYYVVENHPGNNYYEPNKTIVLYNEPWSTRRHWQRWIDSHNFYHIYKERNLAGWLITWSYDDLINKPIIKTKTNYLSSIISDLSFLPGHRLRLNMIRYLDIYLQNDIKFDLYGKKHKNESILDTFKSYKGEINRKDIGLFPYYYHFNCENTRENNYWTEKIIDPILSETLCFYWGNPNIKSWLDHRAFIEVDITRPRQTLEIIIKSIKNDEWTKRKKYIREMKKKYLKELSIIPTISKIIHNN